MSEHRPTTISILATPDSTPSTLFGLFDALSTVGLVWENYVTGRPISATLGKPRRDDQTMRA